MNKSFSVKESLKNPLFLVGLFLLIQVIIRPENMFISDPLVKAVQAFSLKFYNYSSQQIYYPAVDIDPNFELNPLTEGFVFYNKGRYIGQYPVFLSFIYSFITKFTLKYAPYLNAVILLPLLYGFKSYIKNNYLLIFFLFLTVNFSISLDFSENGLFFLLVGIGYLIIINSVSSESNSRLVIGGIIISLSVWFRLEGILFICSLLLAFFLITIYKEKKFYIHTNLIILFSVILSFTILFFIFNFLSYDRYMGPRYIANIENTKIDVYNKLIIFFSILFTFPRESNIAIGFYFYSPIFLLVIYYFLKKFKENSPLINIHLLTILLFSILVGVLSPNDGITITGRYMACGVFPLIFLMDQFFIETSGKYKYLKISLISFSFIITTIIIISFHFISKEFKKHSTYLNSHKANLYITSNELIGGSFSLGYLEKKIITMRKDSDLVQLESILRSNDIKTISLIGYSQSNNSVYNPILSIRDISLKTNYKCNEENHLIYKVYNCSKITTQ